LRLHELLTRSAQRSPAAVAVREADGRGITYGELDRLADRYASAMWAHGVRPGERVVLWVAKSADAVAVMQAALRVGAAYVPVAAANPAGRVARIIESCRPALVVTDQQAPDCVTFEDLLAADPAVAPLLDPAPQPDVAADDLAYVLYTSGSTGEPKGVCISHRNAVAFVEWAVRTIRPHPYDRLANHAPFHFDLSVFDLYGAFFAGASVALVPETMAYAPGELVNLIHERRISVWYSVPSALLLMMRHGLLDHGVPPALRACVFAGEPFPLPEVQALRRAWPEVRMFNWYGPTETNVCASYEVTVRDLERQRPLPIGRPASGAAIRLESRIDSKAGEGEIVVDGPSVMLGYWDATPHSGPYRTGDFGRYDERGELEYVGRIDQMAKVRGYRVEPGEIETALGAHEAISGAVVLVTGSGLDARIHAIITTRSERRPSLFDVKRHCAARLPSHMVVDAVHVVPRIPHTTNGKTDRARLAAALEAGEL
jgi:amino acid adenylation domain-containing protein